MPTGSAGTLVFRKRSKMRAAAIITAYFTIAITACGTLGAFTAPLTVHAAVADWQKGANVVPVNNTDYASGSFDQSLRDLAATGANYVMMEIPLYQSNVNSTDVRTGWDTPTDQSLVSGIQFAHSIGLHVSLKFDVFPNDGQWSAYINPSDRNTWFTNYENQILHFAAIAQSNGVEQLCLGTELIDMSTDDANGTNTSHWLSLIGDVRKAFSGSITYDANWGGSGFPDEKDRINFWSALDYIGISAYFNLSGDGSVSSLMSSWNSWNQSDITPLENKWGKPILFTEVGYMSIYDSYTHPWEWWESGSPNQAQQANDYQALFQYWNQYPFIAGVELWNWTSNPNAGGANDINYTPQNKTAQGVMQQWFGSAPPPPPSQPAFSATASVSPGTPSSGASASFSVSVKDSEGAVSGTNVDVEIYNSGGGQVLQKVFSGQNFAANSSQSYTVPWTAGSAGSYTLKVGIFNGSWSENYYWGNQVLAFSVGASSSGSGTGGGGTTGGNAGGGSGSSTAAGTIQVWWPTNGATVTGVQPFKAMLQNMSVDNYSMYWQVDGGQLNLMPTNSTDYPHKEASVNVTPWTWHGSGPYTVTFVAQDQSSNTIAKASIAIYN